MKIDALPEDVQLLVTKREEARANKDWEEADDIRRQMLVLGYSIEDTSSGPLISKK